MLIARMGNRPFTRAAYQELVDVHAGVDGDLATEVVLELLLPHSAGGVIGQELRKALHVSVWLSEAGRP